MKRFLLMKEKPIINFKINDIHYYSNGIFTIESSQDLHKKIPEHFRKQNLITNGNDNLIKNFTSKILDQKEISYGDFLNLDEYRRYSFNWLYLKEFKGFIPSYTTVILKEKMPILHWQAKNNYYYLVSIKHTDCID
jgi:hypothetical protein